jgi:pilus assembly protein Flp/PilA
MFRRFLRDEGGATAIEYGLIVAVLSLAVIGAFSQAVNVIHNNFNSQTEVINSSVQ